MHEHEKYLELSDFSVTGEKFSLVYNKEDDLLITDPQPSLAKLSLYYESEDYISHTSNSNSLVHKIYKVVRKYTLLQKIKIIKQQHNSGRLLDIGAGTGDFLYRAYQAGFNVSGVEPNQRARDIAIGKGLKILTDTDHFPDNSFDIITMWHVLEHVPNYDSQIAELKRLLNENGTIFIAVPNFKSYDAKFYGKYWAAFDVPRHLWHFSRTSINKIFGLKGFRVHAVLPMIFDAFYVSLLSEKYKHGSTRYLSGFLTGLRSNLKALKSNEYSSHIYIIKLK